MGPKSTGLGQMDSSMCGAERDNQLEKETVKSLLSLKEVISWYGDVWDGIV